MTMYSVLVNKISVSVSVIMSRFSSVKIRGHMLKCKNFSKRLLKDLISSIDYYIYLDNYHGIILMANFTFMWFNF